jgi:nicotinamide phosphoribosyltransferase
MFPAYLHPMLLADFYKIAHRLMYPHKTESVYSTWTPRASRLKGVQYVVNAGPQAFVIKLNSFFHHNFFRADKAALVEDYKRVIRHTLGEKNPETKHIEDLHDLGYLPLLFKALPEGVIVPLRVPVMTVQNTDPRFFWLTNYIETLASCELWQISTSATIANEYRMLLEGWARETVGNTEFVQFQGHDFSMRGMSSLESAVSSGLGHLLSFVGTDTIPAIQAAEFFYFADVEKELIGTSIPATEHSIQCAYGDDMEYLRQIITRVHPTGLVSIVSDGYDFWDVIGRVLPALKKDILFRDGKVVIRPDSGDPADILCGDPNAEPGTLAYKGAVEALWEIFGGTMTPKGYRVLNDRIGLIYGDAITLARAEDICVRLAQKGFASINVVYGIGSYTYQYNTRDTFGWALKSTLCVIDGQEKQIFKDPKTDNGIKKSQKGRVAVLKDGKSYKFVDGLGLNDKIKGDQLEEIYCNGKPTVKETFSVMRARLTEARACR